MISQETEIPMHSSADSLLTRKRVLTLLGGAGLATAATLVGCGGGSTDPAATPTPTPSASPTPTPSADPTPTAGSCVLIPTETQGPYPLLSILTNSAVNRSDITEGKTGVPLTLTFNLQKVGAGCGPITSAAVYIWHCDKDGLYSGYNQQGSSTVGQTFLRGIQVSDSGGQVTFHTRFPGWFAGRITHIHFQVYLNDNLNVTATATSQLAFPQAVTQAVYNSSLYAARGQNSSVSGFGQDNVFRDGTTYQIATVTGDPGSGYAAALNVGIA
jgi:protocatechuate 3,4-dioxygenase beta subunit